MDDFDLSELVAAATRLQRSWEKEGFEFCFIGGLAVQLWGEPRQTNDVDATVWTEFGKERPVVARLLQQLSARIENADTFALSNRVLLAREERGIDIDVSLAAFPFERNLIDRASPQELRGSTLRVCGPSDLIILKAFANRVQDWPDIRGVVIRSESKLDWSLIFSEVETLAQLKEEPEIVSRLRQLRDELTPEN